MPTVVPVSRRRLAWDVLLLVFKVADSSTLAALGRVSLDFLASTVSLLYKDVEIKSIEDLKILFCERKKPTGSTTKDSMATSRIDDLLSLSQIQTLSLDFTFASSVPNDLDLSFARIPSTTALPLRRLLLKLDFKHQGMVIGFLFQHLFPHLNPTRVEYRQTLPTPYPYLAVDLSELCPLKEWTRVGTLVFVNCFFSLGTSRESGVGGLTFLPRPNHRVARVHLPSPPDIDLLVGLIDDSRPTYHQIARQFSLIVLVASSAEEERSGEETIRKLPEKKRSYRFAVELEE